MTDANAPGAFTPVDSKVNFPEMEKRVRSFWADADIFRRSVEERPADNTWVFYEGPPTANGLPHMGHVIQRTLKDLFPRFHTMRGARVVRKAGWDTHGLPVEIEVEKELGLTGKKQEALGHLTRAVELDPDFREMAGKDSDFDAIRDEPEFASAVAGKPDAGGSSS